MTTSTLTTPTLTTPTLTTPTLTTSNIEHTAFEPCAHVLANDQLKAAPVKTDPASGVNCEFSEQVNPLSSWWNQIIGAIYSRYTDEKGMSTIEYALGCVAAAALGALLYTVVTSDTVEQALSGIFEKALNTK